MESTKNEAPTARPPLEFTVNGVPVETAEANLTVAQILTLASLEAATHYLVEKRGEGREIEHRDQTEVVHVHQHSAFLAFFTGPTPVS